MQFIDAVLLKNAWLTAKESYVKDRGAAARDSLLSYTLQRLRRDDFRQYVRS